MTNTLNGYVDLANAQGGKIYVGTDDSGTVVGLANAKKLLDDLPNKIRDKLGLTPDINLLEKNGKKYIEIVVRSMTVPISLRGAYYYRSGSTKQELKGAALNEFLLSKPGKTWDRMIEDQASLDDIDDRAIESFKVAASRAGRLPEFGRAGYCTSIAQA